MPSWCGQGRLYTSVQTGERKINYTEVQVNKYILISRGENIFIKGRIC
jgi:hypothetical protein